MRILVLGSGAREHAIIKALIRTGTPAQDIVAAPGNPGIATEVETYPNLDILNHLDVTRLAISERCDLAIIGPEAPLVEGIADTLRQQGMAVFGPSKEASQIEGSKSFAKEVMAAASIPTAMARECDTIEEVESAMDDFGAPYVIKANGLAAGKGVIVTDNRSDAIAHAKKYLDQGLLVEEFLTGEEVSLFFLSDGNNVMALTPAQDFKRALDNDQGPNTGGMGAYSPIPWLSEGFVEEVETRIAKPAIDQLRAMDMPFIGLLYCGLIVTDSGIKIIEFNARFGDPETQVVLRRLKSDLADLLYRAATGRLEDGPAANFSPSAAVTVVLASEGYPERSVEEREVRGIVQAEALDGVEVCKASPTGRVLSVVGYGETLSKARTKAYLGMEQIKLEGSHFRKDIAAKVIH